MTSDKKLLWLRGIVLVCIAALVVASINIIEPAGMKAPLLTLMGSVAVIITLYPPREIAVQDVGTFLGTVIIMLGGSYWLIDATQGSSANDVLLSWLLASLLIATLMMHVLVSMTILIWKDLSSQ